ncbi:cell division topological specificity factor MinE (plasmid) [Vibrio breoganii]|uniref:Cell division topological specificity factor n=2 Tax=Vibrio TaxID=662 RepID=A0AAN0XZW1_9VIBR|nr:cell division topological specificity factor MinE [Vibrio breoganii]ANO35638.1 cell division topological specificity factor MinE [Vibrio breoganii]PML19304.1 cell division topological specificity factor MinE [Vibrio breoganii]
MKLLKLFRKEKNDTASLAKERLQIVVAEHRCGHSKASHIPQLKRDILEVLSRYFTVDEDMVDVNFEHDKDQLAVLELNVKLPE